MFMQCTPDETMTIATAKSYEQLRDIALAQLQRMQSQIGINQKYSHIGDLKIGIVCGPITNGGAGNGDRAANLRVFGAAVEQFVQKRSGLFFSQMPYEDKIGELARTEIINLGKPVAEHNLLHMFYKPLFESSLIGEMHFLPDWKTSRDATWEREQGTQLGLDIYEISEADASQFSKAA